MDTDLVVICQLVRRRRPLIRFLYIGPYLCSTLPSDPTSRRRPCASLPFTSIRLGRDLHPPAVEHARRTRGMGSGHALSLTRPPVQSPPPPARPPPSSPRLLASQPRRSTAA